MTILQHDILWKTEDIDIEYFLTFQTFKYFGTFYIPIFLKCLYFKQSGKKFSMQWQ